jgi:hypothetical protein
MRKFLVELHDVEHPTKSTTRPKSTSPQNAMHAELHKKCIVSLFLVDTQLSRGLNFTTTAPFSAVLQVSLGARRTHLSSARCPWPADLIHTEGKAIADSLRRPKKHPPMQIRQPQAATTAKTPEIAPRASATGIMNRLPQSPGLNHPSGEPRRRTSLRRHSGAADFFQVLRDLSRRRQTPCLPEYQVNPQHRAATS